MWRASRNLRGAVLGGLIIGCIQQISDNRIGW
jgi:branched-chain amino acid transport system permease protein